MIRLYMAVIHQLIYGRVRERERERERERGREGEKETHQTESCNGLVFIEVTHDNTNVIILYVMLCYAMHVY